MSAAQPTARHADRRRGNRRGARLFRRPAYAPDRRVEVARCRERTAPRRMAASRGRCAERQRPAVAHRERSHLRSRRRRVQRRQRRAAAGGGERAAHRARRPAVSRHGHELRGASGQSLRADFACQRAAVHRARRRSLVVWRRVRPDARISVRGRRAHLARSGARRLRSGGTARLRAAQGRLRQVFLSTASRRNARHRRVVRRRSQRHHGGDRRKLRALFRAHPPHRRHLSGHLHENRPAARGHAFRRRGSRISSACAAGATWSSTSRSIAARASACSPRRAPNRCSCRCRRARSGATTIARHLARPKRRLPTT